MPAMPWPTARRRRRSCRCAAPANSCSLANFFVGDPDLQPGGRPDLRGRPAWQPSSGATDASLRYSLGFFRTNLDDDIAIGQQPDPGSRLLHQCRHHAAPGHRGGSAVQRRALARLRSHYALIDATFQSGSSESSSINPAADANGNITVQPGNRLPGIPAHQFKVGVYYNVTDKWTVGATLLAASGQYLFGDEANLIAAAAGLFHLGRSARATS